MSLKYEGCCEASRQLRPHAGERLYLLYERIRTRLFSAFICRQFGACGRGVVVEPPFRFANLQYVHLEDQVMIHRQCWIHTVSSGNEASTPKLRIQSTAGIGMGATISAAHEIVLGKHVLLARNVYISDHGHAFEDVTTPIWRQGIRGVGKVSIGERTWVGQNSCVMPGVQIGKHCVIGANSVVTRDLPDFCVAVGAPARIIKQYDNATQSWERAPRPSEPTA